MISKPADPHYAYTFRPMDADLSAELIDSAGSRRFDQLLLSIAHKVGGVEEVFGYCLTDNSEPRALVSCSALDDCDKRVEQYSRRFFRHDPAVFAPRAQIANGGFSRRVQVSEIGPHDYRRMCFEQPRFIDKLSFGWRGADKLLVLSFYRRRADDAALFELARLADIAMAALNRVGAQSSESSVVRKLEIRLARSFPLLTMRENQICARTIAGWTADQIGVELGIQPGTVLTYRQRAYRRFDFSSASAFLPALLD